MANLNPNSTDYFHSYEPNTNDLTMAMDYTEDGKPAIRVLSNIQGDIIIEGEVTIPGIVTVTNTDDDPLFTHTHIYDENEVEYTDSNPFTIDGTVTALQGTDPWTVDGTVELGATSLSALENINATVSGTVTVDTITGAVTITDGGGSITVDGSVSATVSGTVSVDNFPATQTVDGTVTIQDGGGSITVDGTVTATISPDAEINVAFKPERLDAFGRLRVSEPYTLFDSSLSGERRYDFDTVTANSGAYTPNYNASVRELTVTAANFPFPL